MKPSFSEQKNVPATDRKFRPEDENLIARDKEDVALSPHGDKIAPREQQKRHDERKGEDSDEVHPSE